MPKGFGQPNFWLQLLWPDPQQEEEWIPIYDNIRKACLKGDRLMVDRQPERILLIDGKVRKGSFVDSEDILADWVPPGSPEAENAQVRYVYK